MLTHSLAITPLAALSRPVVGVYLRDGAEGAGTLIVTLPGSPKGAKENLESLLQLLPHTLDLIGGGSGRAVHKAMGAPDRGVTTPSVAPVAPPSLGHGGGCGHHHHSHGHAAPRPRTLLSQDPSASIAARQRQSPYPLVPLRDAVSLVFEHTYVSPVQTLAVEDSLVGHVLAEDVDSAQNIPGRPSTNVDGYAVRCELIFVSFRFGAEPTLLDLQRAMHQESTKLSPNTLRLRSPQVLSTASIRVPLYRLGWMP